MKDKNLVIFLTKATSSLDFILPLMSKPGYSWTLVFWSKSIDDIVKSDYYHQHIQNSKASVININEFLGIGSVLGKVLNWFFRVFSRNSRVYPLWSRLIEHKIFESIILRGLSRLSPDVVLFDHRGVKIFLLESLKKALVQSKVPTVLFPHAPHHTGIYAFKPFLDSDPLPANFKYWMPFMYDQYWKAIPHQKDQFARSGYPGLDSDWLSELKNNKLVSSSGRFRILIFARKIFPPHVMVKPKGHDNYAFFYSEFDGLIREIRDAADKVADNIDIFIKPHPSTKESLLKNIVSNHRNCFIDQNSVYDQLIDFDAFLSFYTTTILVPIAAKLPSVIYETRIQREMTEWGELNRLYGDLRTYCQDQNQFIAKLKIIYKGGKECESIVEENYRHLREFYPDRATSTSLLLLGEAGV